MTNSSLSPFVFFLCMSVTMNKTVVHLRKGNGSGEIKKSSKKTISFLQALIFLGSPTRQLNMYVIYLSGKWLLVIFLNALINIQSICKTPKSSPGEYVLQMKYIHMLYWGQWQVSEEVFRDKFHLLGGTQQDLQGTYETSCLRRILSCPALPTAGSAPDTLSHLDYQRGSP